MNEENQDTSIFHKLSEIDVNHQIAMKDGFGYLPWSMAVYHLRDNDPSATWEVKRFPSKEGAMVPYLQTELGYFVEVAVTCGGITLSQIHPVLDENSLPLACPTVFDINTSIQRCLVKAIALHGLGLQVYAGEDIPLGEALKRMGEDATDGKKPDGEKSAGTQTPGRSPINSKLIQAIAKINSASLEEVNKAEKFSGQMFEGNDLKVYQETIATRKKTLTPEEEALPL